MSVLQKVLNSRAVAALTSPHHVDQYLTLVNPMWAVGQVRARIVSISRENPDSHAPAVSTITLAPNWSWRGHQAGQHVLLGVELPGQAGRRMTRSFTIASAASAPGEQISVTIRAQAQGQVSKHLVHSARPGDLVYLSQAQGEFILPESPATPTNNHLLMISGGSGITPVMSQLRTLLRDGYDGHAGRRVTFLHYARNQADQIFADELARIARADNGVDVQLRYGPDIFSPTALADLVGDFRNLDTWACGPAPMMELIQAAYGDSPRLRTEFFKLATGTATANAEGTLTFAEAGVERDNDGRSILEQAEAAGLSPTYGCRMGICFSCVATKSSGTVTNLLTGELSDLPDEPIRICVSAPQGPCSMQL